MSIFDKTFLMAISRWLRILPEKSFSKHSRVLATALMILKFPHQILLGDESAQLQSEEKIPFAIASNFETRNCFRAARSVTRALKQLLELSIAPQGSRSLLSASLQSFLLKAKLYIASFEEWEHYDSQKVAASIEESFRESYAVFLAARGAIQAGNSVIS